jgi:organic radical activating enzyme
VTVASTLKVNEIFASLQGEGASLGAPSLFVRLALCNLRCEWCDTRYTWEFERYDRDREVHPTAVTEVAARIISAPERRVVITGGEPLMQQAALAQLFELIPASIAVEVETNGTLAPEPSLVARVDQWNVSPKLSHAGDEAARRIKIDVLRAFRDTGRAFLKFVVRERDDIGEVRALVHELAWPEERVLLMPEATTAAVHAERSALLAALCQEHGFRFSPRLHVLLWGGERAR